MKRILKEPLIHFLVLGAAIFVAYGFLSKRNAAGPEEIVITQGQIEHLATTFEKTWQRPPMPDELAGLIHDRVREEVYCREAMALGLDQDDTIIRRRLRQKMEFVSDDIAARAEPTDDDLNAWLRDHPESFRTDPRFTFRQVYLNPQKHGDHLTQDAAKLLEQMNRSGQNTESQGDPFMLEHRFASVTENEIAKQFGRPFASKLAELKPGEWQGPVESGYGAHLVLVTERSEGGLPALADIRDLVRREWENARRMEANEAFYQSLLKRYTVTIEKAEPQAGQAQLVTKTTE